MLDKNIRYTLENLSENESIEIQKYLFNRNIVWIHSKNNIQSNYRCITIQFFNNHWQLVNVLGGKTINFFQLKNIMNLFPNKLKKLRILLDRK